MNKWYVRFLEPGLQRYALLGSVRMCQAVADEIKRLSNEQPDHPWHEPLKAFLKPAGGQFAVTINEEVPPDRMVFYDLEGAVLEVVKLPAIQADEEG